MSEFYRPVVGKVEAFKFRDVSREKAIRLYCYATNSTWALQIRSPIRLSSGLEGKDFIVSNAMLNLGDMVALREALNGQIEAANE